jgi:hypothetical protein
MAGVLPESAARRKSGGFDRKNGYTAVDGAGPPAPLRRAIGRLGDFISASCDFKTLGAFFCNERPTVLLAKCEHPEDHAPKGGLGCAISVGRIASFISCSRERHVVSSRTFRFAGLFKPHVTCPTLRTWERP